MTKFSHPAWLIAAALISVSAVSAATLGVTGCSHSAGLSRGAGSLAERVFGTTSSPLSSPMALTNASIGGARLAFGATVEADVPVEELLAAGDRPLAMNGLCPPDMASIDDKFCVDKYEASLVEVMPNGEERAFPYYQGVEGHVVRAVSEKGVYPQGYISEKQAIEACGRSAKRLCKPAEWKTACKGPEPKKFGYSDQRTPGTCNDTGKSPVGLFYGAEVASGTAWQWDKMNDPQLNQMAGGLAETGSHDGCTNGYGVYDMVGNLHEWVLDPEGTFQGGYYLDVTQNGDGCGYRTDAHAAWYHDYSTGFRCCADVAQ
ncbi:MAG: Protein kinase domain protein [Labilithrix sp.]|nr:Protein kinase domain protein [Labilithrix sp.]